MSERSNYFVETSGIEFSGPHKNLTGEEGALASVEQSRMLLEVLKRTADRSTGARDTYQALIDNLTIRIESTTG